MANHFKTPMTMVRQHLLKLALFKSSNNSSWIQ
jgi:hypothetical protein